ncbi:hypothetical protein F4802DRAFT_608623 [Xylaria palmicola]|nr:hypothetical protein F4802DRAFT_608623 [Xylaria palmicola]
MTNIDIVGRLYPGVGTEGFDAAAFAIGLDRNEQRYVARRREKPQLVVAQPQVAYSSQDREATQDPEKHDSLDYTAYLKIDLSQIPKTSLGLVAGWDPRSDIVLPQVPGVSFHHFSLTFNDAYCLVVRDLGSRIGTSVIYGDKDEGPRSNYPWIVGGDENLKGRGPITIRVVLDLQFRIVVNAYDINSEAFQAKVNAFRAGTAGLEDTFGNLDIRPPTQLPTGIHTPVDKDIVLKKKLGEGGFAIVHHTWNVRTGESYALKEPREEFQKTHLKVWENEALLMGRISHDHIVKLLGFEVGPPPSLRFEYLPGGSLRQHLLDSRYFSPLECVHITRQASSALAYLHKLKPSITHRDITDGNILIDHRSINRIYIKLGDFGISKEGPELNTIIGTPVFLPPEFFSKTVSNKSRTGQNYTTAIDIWGLGAVIAKLLCGHPRRKGEHKDGKLWCEDIRRRVEAYFKRKGDALAQLLLETMLCMEPETRMEAWECHDRSLLLPEGSRDTWKAKAPVLTPCERDDRGTEEDEDEMTTICLQDRNHTAKPPRIIVDRGTEGVTTDPGMNDGNFSNPPSSASFENLGVTASVREPCLPGATENLSMTASVQKFYRSDAPPPSTRHHTELYEILDKMSDPEGSLFVKSDIGGDSQFSEDAESDPGTLTPRNPSPAHGLVPPTSVLMPPDEKQKCSAIVPQKRKFAVGPQAKALQSFDFSQLVAKLGGIPPERDISSREFAFVPSPSPAARSATLSPQHGVGKEHQIRCYHWLVSEGGRPVCSLEILDEIYENPEPHMEMLRPWLGDAHASTPDDLGVFSRSLERWREFRRWQADNRGYATMDEEGFAAFLDEKRRYMESKGLDKITTRPDFEKTMRKRWLQEQGARQEQRECPMEVPNGGFKEYAEAARRRLESHSFVQQFELLEDRERQDERVTWIEYLEFEYWWLDKYMASVQHTEKRLGDGTTEECVQYERSKKRESSQRLRVKWVLSKMPAAAEALQSTTAAPDGKTRGVRERRATQKRKRGDENEVTDWATDETVKQPAKRQEKGKQGTTRQADGRKGLSRMLLGLETPVPQTRVRNIDGTRRSTRIKGKKVKSRG